MAAKTKTPAKMGVSDAEADVNNPAVAAAAAAIRERPEGMPAVWPLHALPRRKRADAEALVADTIDSLSALQDVKEQLSAAGESNTGQSDLVRIKSKMTRALADVTDALAVASHDEAAFREWADAADDETLFAGFGWYVGTMQPGEAAGSQ